MKDSFAKVSSDGITVYDTDFKERMRIMGLALEKMVYVDDSFMYCIQNKIVEQPRIVTKDGEVEQKGQGKTEKGFYVYDVDRMMEGSLETYKLFSTVAGVNNQLDVSHFSQRFSFLANFNHIKVVPFPHLNLVNMVGMAQKQQYLVWREKNGFFTALNRDGELLTWSLITGKLLYRQTETGNDTNNANIRDYQVYLSDPSDVTYVRNYYNFENRTV